MKTKSQKKQRDKERKFKLEYSSIPTEQRIDIAKIDNIQLDGIDTDDYPDFADAYIVSADYYGNKMTDDMIDYINNNMSDFVYECVLEQLF